MNRRPCFPLIFKLTCFYKDNKNQHVIYNTTKINMLFTILQANVIFSYLFSLSFDMNFVYRPEYDDEQGTPTSYDEV